MFQHLLKATLLVWLMSYTLDAQEVDVYKVMRPILEEITHLADYGACNMTGFDLAMRDVNQSGLDFKESEENSFTALSTTDPAIHLLKIKTYRDEYRGYMIQLISGDVDSVNTFWQKIRPKDKGWTGYETYYEKYVYMIRDSTQNSLAGSMYISPGAIVSLTKPLDFKVMGRANSLTAPQSIKAKAIFEDFLTILNSLSDQFVPASSLIYKPSEEQLTAAERIYGFTQFWTEVKYNFAFFHQVPELNWDEVYREYLPLMMVDQSNTIYYKNLAKLCALLQDGHTNVYPPANLRLDAPALWITNINQRAIVENMDKSLASDIPKGTEIIAVDGVKTIDYIKDKILPYISSSTHHILWNNGIRDMLQGDHGSKVEITLRHTNGRIWTQTLIRNRNKINLTWHHPWPQSNKPLELFALEHNTAHILLNTFGNDVVVKDFERIIDTLRTFDHFIIDIRSNGGGSSTNGYNILKHFATQDFQTSKWSTREHLSSFKAWGSYYATTADSSLSTWELKAKEIHAGKYWHTSDPDTIAAEGTIQISGKLMVLIGNNTASASEDFLVALDDLGIGTLIGQTTYGSTGQPLMLKMPRGGNARICTKRDTYPDGREFVGYGIKPDVEVQQSLEDFLQGFDRELEVALNLIKEGR